MKLVPTKTLIRELTGDLTSAGRMNSKSYHNKRLLEFSEIMFNRGSENMIKAFGGCKHCYGKGYATVRIGTQSARTSEIHQEMRFCSCARGKQLRAIIMDFFETILGMMDNKKTRSRHFNGQTMTEYWITVIAMHVAQRFP